MIPGLTKTTPFHYKKVNVPQDVGKEFVEADKKEKK